MVKLEVVDDTGRLEVGISVTTGKGLGEGLNSSHSLRASSRSWGSLSLFASVMHLIYFTERRLAAPGPSWLARITVVAATTMPTTATTTRGMTPFAKTNLNISTENRYL